MQLDTGKHNKFARLNLWLVFGLYVSFISIIQFFHEPWGDELQTWALIKNSSSFFNLISNCSLDGHPPLWYAIVYLFSKLTHSFHVIQLVALLISSVVAFLFVFYSRLPLLVKSLTLAGYYFVFEYSLFSRNYFIVVLISFLICINLTSTYKYKYLVYYVLLFLLCHTHFFALFLAVTFHLYFLKVHFDEGAGKQFFLKHTFIAIGILFAFIGMTLFVSTIAYGSTGFLGTWDSGRLTLAAQMPLRAFLPIPAWWEYHFWNTNAVWNMAENNIFLKWMAVFISASILTMVFFIFAKTRRALIFFGINTTLMLLLASLFPIYNTRYVGFLYIGFLVSLWLNSAAIFSDATRRKMVYAIIIFQIPGGLLSVSKEISLPFSQINETAFLLEEVPKDEALICDFWALLYLNAVNHKSYYCVESKKKQKFLLGDKDWNKNLSDKHRYTNGIEYYFKENNCEEVYFVCNFSPLFLAQYDSLFYRRFHVKLVAAKIGAIERFSDLYLYHISTP